MGTGTLPSVKFVIFTETLSESYCLYHSLLFLFAFLFQYFIYLFIYYCYSLSPSGMDHDLAGNLLHMIGSPNSAIAHFAMVFSHGFKYLDVVGSYTHANSNGYFFRVWN